MMFKFKRKGDYAIIEPITVRVQTVDPKLPSYQSPIGQRRSVDGVRRTGGPVAQPQPLATAAPAAAPAKPKQSRRQQRKAVKQAKKISKPAKQAKPAKMTKQPMPAVAPSPQDYGQATFSEQELSQPRSSSKLKVFFQTLLAIIVIIAVALAIVVLYVRYYQ